MRTILHVVEKNRNYFYNLIMLFTFNCHRRDLTAKPFIIKLIKPHSHNDEVFFKTKQMASSAGFCLAHGLELLFFFFFFFRNRVKKLFVLHRSFFKTQNKQRELIFPSNLMPILIAKSLFTFRAFFSTWSLWNGLKINKLVAEKWAR